MTGEEIRKLAQKFHAAGEHIKKDWHPVYQKECEKINRKELEKSLMKKYNVSGKVNKEVKTSKLLTYMAKA